MVVGNNTEVGDWFSRRGRVYEISKLGRGARCSAANGTCSQPISKFRRPDPDIENQELRVGPRKTSTPDRREPIVLGESFLDSQAVHRSKRQDAVSSGQQASWAKSNEGP